MTRWLALLMAPCLGLLACATASPTTEASAPVTRPALTYAIPEALLDAQLNAIVGGDAAAAVGAFGAQAVLSGPKVGQVAFDSGVRDEASGLFTELARQGFEPRRVHRVVGGKDLDTVRWSVDRFMALGVPWVVTTLMSRDAGWAIAAQTWDIAEPDEFFFTLAREGTLASPPAIEDGGVAPPPALTAWVEMLSRNPTDLSVAPPLRGDTYNLGTAGEYAQSDEAYLATMAQMREGLAAGHVRFERLPGQVVRLTPDGVAGVAVFQTAVTLSDEEGPVTLPVRATIYFLNQPAGPRYVGGHFMAAP